MMKSFWLFDLLATVFENTVGQKLEACIYLEHFQPKDIKCITLSLHVQWSTFPNMFKASASSNFLFPCLATCNACSKRLNACASASDFMWTLPIENKHLYSVSLRLWSLGKQQAKNLSFKKLMQRRVNRIQGGPP